MLVAGAEAKPSFDCAQATTKVEKLVCATPAVARLDAELARTYRARVEQLRAAERRGSRARSARRQPGRRPPAASRRVPVRPPGSPVDQVFRLEHARTDLARP
ncbi:MAG TPA: hypothetical protein VEB43_05785 [Anaeromyxobacter sp.]|nr:hypothetical protein [Anaeromyxobacter sp.]